MNRIALYMVVLTCLCIGGALHAQTRLVTFTTDSLVLLRWVGPEGQMPDGYHVYRSIDGGAFERITDRPVTPVLLESRIEEVAGYKTDIYLGLFGAEAPRDLTIDDYRRTLGGEGADLVRMITLVNPEFGILMGETYRDSPPAGATVGYRITALSGGQEREVGTSGQIHTGVAQVVPPVSDLEVDPAHRAVHLRWPRDQRALDAGAVVSYNVYRAPSPAGPFTRINTSQLAPLTVSFQDERLENPYPDHEQFVDRWLENGTPYYYHVRSVNPFGIESSPSIVVEVTPQDDRRPPPPFDIRAEISGNNVVLQWATASTSPVGVEVYRSTRREGIYQRLLRLPAGPDSLGRIVDTDIHQGGEYFYYLRAISETGVRSVESDTLSFLFPDATPPAPPSNIQVEAVGNGLRISWASNTEPDLLGYEIERVVGSGDVHPASLNSSPVEGITWLDTISPASESYYGYTLYAVDRSYNRSAGSRTVFARMPDANPPQTPIINRLFRRGRELVLQWTRSPASDLAGYVIYRSSDTGGSYELGRSFDPEFTDIPTADGTYHYTVAAADSAGNISQPSAGSSIDYTAHNPIQPPARLAAHEKDTHILLEWTAVDGAAGYAIWRVEPKTGRRLLLAETGPTTTEYRDGYSNRAVNWTYIIQAFDSMGKESTEGSATYSPGG